MDNKVVVIGGGGHAKVVISVLRLCGYQPAVVLDDLEALWGTNLLDVPVRGPINSVDLKSFDRGIIAVGRNDLRQELAAHFRLSWVTAVHPDAWVDASVVLGAGTVVFAGAVIQPGTVIGEHVIINTSASVDHDCVLDNFVHIAPGVHLAGNVRVGEGSFMGISSTAIPGIRVGAWTTVGAGAVVVRELMDNVVAYGVPAKVQRTVTTGETPDKRDGRTARILSTADKQEWLDVLSEIPQHDFYHLPQYHALEEKMGRGAAYLFAYSEGPYHIALPVMLRPVGTAPGLERFGDQWFDASSVYGYVGPVVSHTDVPQQVIENFQGMLHEGLKEMEVVTVFSRMHPLLSQEQVLRALGERKPSGQTVSIDLTKRLHVQRQKYRKGHRSDISKGKSRGVVCKEDMQLVHLRSFVEIYHETMQRLRANAFYFFGRNYFDDLISALGQSIHLFVALWQGEMIAGALIVECSGIVQYHLGGAKEAFRHMAPIKLILDAVRIWATERGHRVLHLGGGVGSREDSLFYFKTGFSDRRHQFSTWQWVVLPDVYEELCRERIKWEERQRLVSTSSDFFPHYRSSVNPK